MMTTSSKSSAAMDGLFDVQDSALNSSLAEILASMAAEAEADAAPSSSAAGGGGGGRAASSPLLGEHEILSNSLQEFLKYEDPNSPIISSAAESFAIEEDVPSSTTPAARSPRFTVHRNPSFTPSLKGFLFSKDDGVVGRIETTTCSLTNSGSESSDPHTYLPRLTDGSVSVLHSIENNDLQELSSLDDSMRSGDDDTSSSSNDRDHKLTGGVVDLGSVKAELDKNFGVRLHNQKGLGDSPTPAPANVSAAADEPSDDSPSGSPSNAAVTSLVETCEGNRNESSCAADRNPPNEGTHTTITKNGRPTGLSAEACASTASCDAGSTTHVVPVPERPVKPTSSTPTVPIVPPAQMITPEVSLTQTEPSVAPSNPAAPPAVPIEQAPQQHVIPAQPQFSAQQETQMPSPSQQQPSPVSSSPSPLSNAARSPRHSSIGNDQCEVSPSASPSRRNASTPRRRSSTGSASSRIKGSPPPVAPILSPTPKHRSKSSPRTRDKKVREVQASPSIHNKETAVVPLQFPATDVELTTVPRLSSNSSPEKPLPVKAPKSPTTLSVCRAVELPAASTSPKSPHRELRLKIQIDEMRSPNDAVNGREHGGDGTEDEALPQMLKMLLDGVANKIRKHAKQESMRKIRTMETSGSSTGVESPTRSVRQAVPLGSTAETSGSPKQRIKVRIDKGNTSSPRKDGTSSSLSPSKSGRRRVSLGKTEEKTTDFDPHSVGKSGRVDEHRAGRDSLQSSRRHKERSSEEKSRSRSSKPDHGKHDTHHREVDWNPEKVPRPESTTDRPRRRSVERDASSRRMSGGGRHDERVRSKSSSEEKQHRSSRSRSKASSGTSRTKPQQSDDHQDKKSSLKAKLDEGPDRSSRGLGSRSVCSKSSRKRREGSTSEEANDSSHHRSRKPSDLDAKASSLVSTLEREEKKKIGASSSRSVCSRSSRKHKDGSDERRLSHSYHSRSVHSSSKSVHSSSRSVHSASKSSAHSSSRSSSKSRKEVTPTVDPSTPPLNSSASSPGRSDVTEAIEYDFNDDPPQKGADSDRQGRSFRRGSGPSSARGRSQSSRRLRSDHDSGLAKTGRSQSQRHIPSDRTSSLSSSRRSQSHRHLKSGEPEYQLGLGIDSQSHKTSSRSSSQPPASSRHARPESARAESVERSGARRSRSRPAPPEGRKELSLSGLSRSQLEEGAKSVASSASDRTPRRSGGRGPSPNARSRTQPTSLLGQIGNSSAVHHQAPGPPGRSPVVQPQVSTTVSRLRGVHKALSFRDLFGRDPDPWQEFTSPTRQPKPSCLPVVGTTTVAPAPVGTTSAKGRSMPKFLSAVGNSFQRSSSARFPEVSKSELDASFESFHPFESSGGAAIPASDNPQASMTSSTTSSSTPPSPPLSGGPSAVPAPPLQAPAASERGWTQKFFR
jgi:hypothetical protein